MGTQLHPAAQAQARPSAAASRPAATLAVLAAVLGLAAASWVVTVRQMTGMDMGVATRLGSQAAFLGLWTPMMAAMMLPGATPAVMRRARAGGSSSAAVFTGSYLAVWALAGLLVHAVYRPHGTAAAGVITVAAGLYELTPVKRRLRRRCQGLDRSGAVFGLCCLGSSAGLMAMQAALGLMSLSWMAVITVLALAQKMLPPRNAIDVPVALAITGLGLVIIIAPALVPGLIPAAM